MLNKIAHIFTSDILYTTVRVGNFFITQGILFYMFLNNKSKWIKMKKSSEKGPADYEACSSVDSRYAKAARYSFKKAEKMSFVDIVNFKERSLDFPAFVK